METAWLRETSPVLLALVATLFTWGVTALGAAMVFFFKSIKKRILNTMLGFAAGVMIAASYWSLLKPAIEMSAAGGGPPWLPAVVGFLSGGAFLLAIDKILPHLHMGLDSRKAEGIKTSWQRSTLLILAITLHNIPEGLAVGVAFGAAGGGAGRRRRWAAPWRWPSASACRIFPKGRPSPFPCGAKGFPASRRSGTGSCRDSSSRSPA